MTPWPRKARLKHHLGRNSAETNRCFAERRFASVERGRVVNLCNQSVTTSSQFGPASTPARRETMSFGSQRTVEPGPPVAAPSALQTTWRRIRGRIFSGLLLVAPIFITLWLVHWLYTALAAYAIDPLARLVILKFQRGQADESLPVWFETYAAPIIAVVIVLFLLYCLGFLIHSRLHRFIDRILLRIPVISGVYDGFQKVIQVLDKKEGQQRPQRVVLVPFPHPGMKLPAFVTGSCRDIATRKVILCVYVPTTPVPTSGYFLMVPEDDVTELNWTTDQVLQSIISAGLTAPTEVSYFKSGAAADPGAGERAAIEMR
jgi:uncharacterized membrane protein